MTTATAACLQVEGEKAEIHRMQDLGLLTIHDTACKASRIHMHVFPEQPRLDLASTDHR